MSIIATNAALRHHAQMQQFVLLQDKATAQTSRKNDDATAKKSAHPFLLKQMQNPNCVRLKI